MSSNDLTSGPVLFEVVQRHSDSRDEYCLVAVHGPLVSIREKLDEFMFTTTRGITRHFLVPEGNLWRIQAVHGEATGQPGTQNPVPIQTA